MSKELNINVVGERTAELPVPFWLRVFKFSFAVGVFSVLVSGAFKSAGWQWLSEGFTPEASAKAAAVITLAAIAAHFSTNSTLFAECLGLRKNRKWFYTGTLSARFILPLALGLACFATTRYFIKSSIEACPLPKSFVRVDRETPAPLPQEGLVPIYFWDYATWINPGWLSQLNLVLPYEKGLPKKLLPKIYFEDAKTHTVVLELHGKRPRTYQSEEVNSIFASHLPHPRDWPLIWKLEGEAGISTAFSQGVPQDFAMYLVEMRQADIAGQTRIVGVPWYLENSLAGRFFYWGTEGTVFQVRCASPCLMARMLELVQFSPNPSGTLAQRREWTAKKIRELLDDARRSKGGKFVREKYKDQAHWENMLTLYLVSMLTLDPRDPEAFFHLGKLARNRETLRSAIKYGRDLGLEPAKLSELEALAN